MPLGCWGFCVTGELLIGFSLRVCVVVRNATTNSAARGSGLLANLAAAAKKEELSRHDASRVAPDPGSRAAETEAWTPGDRAGVSGRPGGGVRSVTSGRYPRPMARLLVVHHSPTRGVRSLTEA